MTVALLLASAGLVAALAAGLVRARGEVARARERLETASDALERVQAAFARFAPAALVDEIVAHGVPTTGERKEVTALFADLVGFTAFSERTDPAVLVRVVNGYFECMSDAILRNQGHISTLIGDGILALFGAIEPNPWQSDDAVRAALAMRTALADYNRSLAAEGLPPLALGIGLHRGVGVAGLVGSRDLKQFTVVGTVVNVAARVQALTRLHRVDVLLTSDVRAAIDPGFKVHPLPPSEVRGLSGLVTTFALGGTAPTASPDQYAV